MKLTVIVMVLLLHLPAFSKNRFGLGVILGSPTGLTGKLLRPGNKPIDAALTFGDEFEFHSTFLFPQRKRLQVESLDLRWYWGLGGKLKNIRKKLEDNKLHFGPRASAGINHYYKKYSLEAFGELAANVFIVPESKVSLDLFIGARYYF